jgi:2,3-bisphosphoglycerate-dependent phosphoglycerate mutase
MIQAKALGKSLKDEPITHILSSDLTRARRTASEVAAYHPNVPLVTNPVLRERDFGDLEGKPWTQAHMTEARGESQYLLQTRAVEAWNWILEEGKTLEAQLDSFVVVLSHGLFLSILFSTICAFYNTSKPEKLFWRNTAYAKLVVTPGNPVGLTVESINDARHLQHLKRQKGGLGSMKYDTSQKTLQDFFSSPKKQVSCSGIVPPDLFTTIPFMMKKLYRPVLRYTCGTST